MRITKNKLLPAIHSEAQIKTSLSQSLINAYKNKLLLSTIKFQLAAGTHSAVAISDIITAGDLYFEIEGDIRSLSGLSFVQGKDPNTADFANSGNGVITLSNSGNTLTVARSITNPNFATDYSSADTLVILDDSGAVTEAAISSIAANVFTLAATAPIVGGVASAVCLLPNRSISGAMTIVPGSARIRLKGFKFITPGHIVGSSTNQLKDGLVKFENCVFKGSSTLLSCQESHVVLGKNNDSSDVSFYDTGTAATFVTAVGPQTFLDFRGTTFLKGSAAVSLGEGVRSKARDFSILRSLIGIQIDNGAFLHLVSGSIEMTNTGISATYAAPRISATSLTIKRKSGSVVGYGIEARQGADIALRSPAISYFNIGIYAYNGARIFTQSAVYVGNNTDRSPSSGHFGNNAAVIMES